MRNLYQDKDWDQLSKATAMREWQQTLPTTNDFQEHAVEVKIDALPAGEYILLTSANNTFPKQGALGAQFFYVSNISYVNQDNKFFILNRESGQPINKAAVQVFVQTYDYKTYNYVKQKLGDYTSDQNGLFQVAFNNDQRERNYFLEERTGTDSLKLYDQF